MQSRSWARKISLNILEWVLLFICLAILLLVWRMVGVIAANPWSLENGFTYIMLIVLAISSGFIFYSFRRRRRRVYGFIEVAAGAATFVFAFVEMVEISTSANNLRDNLQFSTILKLAGGMYIIVRGLDNIGEGHPPNQKKRWDNLFKTASELDNPDETSPSPSRQSSSPQGPRFIRYWMAGRKPGENSADNR